MVNIKNTTVTADNIKAAFKVLTDNGVMFEDSDAACYVDDAGTKTTWTLNVTLEKCPEYGGE